MKSLKTAAAALLCVGALAGGTGSAEATQEVQDGGSTVLVVNTFQSLGTQRCMDDSQEFGFRTFPCNSGRYQQWDVHVFKDGTRRFQNQITRRCLRDGSGGFGVGACDSSENASWFISRHHSVRITFRNQDTDKCIDDSDDSGFRTTRCNGGIYQDWV